MESKFHTLSKFTEAGTKGGGPNSSRKRKAIGTAAARKSRFDLQPPCESVTQRLFAEPKFLIQRFNSELGSTRTREEANAGTLAAVSVESRIA